MGRGAVHSYVPLLCFQVLPAAAPTVGFAATVAEAWRAIAKGRIIAQKTRERKSLLYKEGGGDPCCSLSVYIFLPHFHNDSSCTDIHDSYIISGQKKKSCDEMWEKCQGGESWRRESQVLYPWMNWHRFPSLNFPLKFSHTKTQNKQGL